MVLALSPSPQVSGHSPFAVLIDGVKCGQLIRALLVFLCEVLVLWKAFPPPVDPSGDEALPGSLAWV